MGWKNPKMDGENKGSKPYEQMDDLRGFSHIFGNTQIFFGSFSPRKWGVSWTHFEGCIFFQRGCWFSHQVGWSNLTPLVRWSDGDWRWWLVAVLVGVDDFLWFKDHCRFCGCEERSEWRGQSYIFVGEQWNTADIFLTQNHYRALCFSKNEGFLLLQMRIS